VFEQFPVLLHGGPAAGRVHHDAVGARPLEHLDVVTGQLAGPVDVAGVQRQRAAAALLARHTDAAAFSRQDTGGGLVDVAEREPLHAAGQQGDRATLLSGRRMIDWNPAEEALPRDGRGQFDHGEQAAQQPAARPGRHPARQRP
jgi:hypothetical protein